MYFHRFNWCTSVVNQDGISRTICSRAFCYSCSIVWCFLCSLLTLLSDAGFYRLIVCLINILFCFTYYLHQYFVKFHLSNPFFMYSRFLWCGYWLCWFCFLVSPTFHQYHRAEIVGTGGIFINSSLKIRFMSASLPAFIRLSVVWYDLIGTQSIRF